MKRGLIQHPAWIAMVLSATWHLTAFGSSLTDGRSTISFSDFKLELQAMPSAARETVLNDRRALGRYASSVLANVRVAEAARATGLESSPELRAAVRKTERDTLARLYLDVLISAESAKLPNLEPLAEETYLAHLDQYRIPEGIRVLHILFRVDPEVPEKPESEVRAIAEKYLAELTAGRNFRELAEAVSEDKGTAKRGGEIPGWIEKGKMVPPFEAVAFALKPDEMSGLVRTRYGFHIIKKLEARQASVRPFADVKEQIIKSLKDQRVGQIRNEIVGRFLSSQDVEVSEEFAAALRAELAK